MKKIICVALVLLSLAAHSEETPKDSEKSIGDKAIEKIQDAHAKYKKEIGEMAQRRRDATANILGHYSPLSMWVPSKVGVSLGYIKDEKWTYELEGLYGSLGYELLGINLAKFSEVRLNLMARYFSSGSFNLFFGLHYEKIDLTLGDNLLGSFSAADKVEYNLLEIENVGVVGGLGNRWLFKNGFTLGVDWIALNQPIYSLKSNARFLDSNASQSDKDAVDRGLSVLKYLPRVTFLKLGLGWTF